MAQIWHTYSKIYIPSVPYACGTMNGNQIEYVGVNLPKSLMDDVDNIIKGRRGGYRSRAEFLKDATRQLLFKIYGNNSNRNYQSDKTENEEKKKMELPEGGEERNTKGGEVNGPQSQMGENKRTGRNSHPFRKIRTQLDNQTRSDDARAPDQKQKIKNIGGEGPYEGRIKEEENR